MNLSAPFIARPVATTLLALAIALAGALGYSQLPVSPLPEVDFPTVSVSAQLPGASPDTVATSLTEPLERHLGSIADVTEMTSQSQVGSARITLQFALSRDIDGAARDVQAAINAAAADLPSNLLSKPTYRKVNPADAPVTILALTSSTLTRGQMYDAASSVIQQSLSQLPGVGQVIIGGATLPAVRVELNPSKLFHFGIGLEDVRSAIAGANANAPKGQIDVGKERWQIYTNDQSNHAADYQPLVAAYRNGDAVRLRDIAEVSDSVQDLRNLGLAGGKPAVLVIVFRQPGANILSAVDGVKAAIPRLKAALPKDVDISVAMDQSQTIRASLNDTRITLLISMILVVVVVFAFLRNGRATIIPAVAVPISVVGAFGAMYVFHYSLDNLSLMALTVATGFVVDDAIVVLENISRHIEDGMAPVAAAFVGAKEVGFTVVSITLSLVAVFLPILLMGGLIGRLFQEFAMTLTLAILISMILSLTATPMLCALFLRPNKARRGPLRKTLLERAQDFYASTLARALLHSRIVLLALLAFVGLNVWLIDTIPKGFFPEQDTGRITGAIVADQSISFQLMSKKLTQLVAIVKKDAAVASVVGYTGGGGGGGSQTNSGSVFIALKPLSERDRMPVIMARLRRSLSGIAGARLVLQPSQDIRVGGRQSNALYQYTILGDSTAEVYAWAPRLMAAMQKDKTFADVSSDQQIGGVATNLVVNRDTASRLGLTLYQIDNTLYDAFGQRSVSTIYSALNQYHVVMEVAPAFWQSPEILKEIWVSTSGAAPSGSAKTQLASGTITAPTRLIGPSALKPSFAPSFNSVAASAGNRQTTLARNPTVMGANALDLHLNSTIFGAGAAAATAGAGSGANNAVRTAAQSSLGATGTSSSSTGAAVATSVETMTPLAAVASFGSALTPLSVNHQSEQVATTISFNLPADKSLSDAQGALERLSARIELPADLHGGFAGTALVYQQSLSGEALLILAALAAIYIVLGVLYESFVHPLTIMSTLPSAGVGAFLALMAFGLQFTIIALIGVVLLIGIVQKNAILMIDFAIKAERTQGMSPRDAIYQAAALRFRPIMMTTTAALLGALPLCFSFGMGSELRQPLGIAIVGGLIVSQALTLYSTPVVYLTLDRVRLRARGAMGMRPDVVGAPGAAAPAE